MKFTWRFAWRNDIVDLAAWNSQDFKEVNMIEYKTLLQAEVEGAEWEKEMDVDTWQSILDSNESQNSLLHTQRLPQH